LCFPIALTLLMRLASPVAAQSDERALDAERRALESERRALEAERRALEAERDASTGSKSETRPQECQRATAQYERICSAPSRDVIGDTPECAAAQAQMRERCGR
jgi:hypothetical protein